MALRTLRAPGSVAPAQAGRTPAPAPRAVAAPSVIAAAAQARANVAAKAAPLSFGNTLTKTVQQQQAAPSPFNISAIDPKSVQGLKPGGSSLNLSPAILGSASRQSSSPTGTTTSTTVNGAVAPTFGQQLNAIRAPGSVRPAQAGRTPGSPFNISSFKDPGTINTSPLSFDTSSFEKDEENKPAFDAKRPAPDNLSTPEALAAYAKQFGGTNLQSQSWWSSNPNKQAAWALIQGTPQIQPVGQMTPLPETPETPAVPDLPETPPVTPPADDFSSIVAPFVNPNASEGENAAQTTALQNQILQALEPTKEEQEIERQLRGELDNLELGKADLEDRPVAMGLITGQQASVEKRGNLRTANLQSRLQQMQNVRLAKLQSLEKAYGFQEGALTRQFQEKQFNAQQAFQKEQFGYQKQQDSYTNALTAATKGLKYNNTTGVFDRDETIPQAQDLELAKYEASLAKDFRSEKAVDDYTVLNSQYGKMKSAVEFLDKVKGTPEEKGAYNFVDQTLVTVFNKILDPTSVVREAEYSRTPEGLAAFERAQAYVDSVTKGGILTPESRLAAVRIAGDFINAAKEQFQQVYDFYRQRSDKQGTDIDSIAYIPNMPSSINASGGTPRADSGSFGIPQEMTSRIQAGLQSRTVSIDAIEQAIRTDYPNLTDAEIAQYLDSL